jgi:hypothetical protein
MAVAYLVIATMLYFQEHFDQINYLCVKLVYKKAEFK